MIYTDEVKDEVESGAVDESEVVDASSQTQVNSAELSREEAKSPQKKKTIDEKLYSDESVATSIQKCPNCGGETVFDAKLQKTRCLYCGGTFDIANESTVTEQDIDGLLTQATVWKEADVYRCQTCGAKQIISKQDVAHTCPFCGTSHIIKTEELPGLKPQGVVPFKMPVEKVAECALKWVKKRFFAPRAFKQSAKPENIHGVYNPVFTFDSETKSSYEGRLGETVRTDKGSHTRYFHVSGNIDVNFDDLLVQASSAITTTTLNKISPFSTNTAPAYTDKYLRGFKASTYNKDGKACWEEGKDLMSAQIERKILSRYHYDTKDYLNVKTAYLKQKYKYVLVPVYVGHHTYKGKLYNFYVNGENGKVTGKTPLSPFKVTLAVILGILFVAGVVFLAMYLGD